VVRALGAVIAVIAAAILVAVAVGAFGPTSPAAKLRSSTPSAGSRPTESAASPTRAITITFTEQELTTAAERYTPVTVSGITVTGPKIRLDPGRLTFTATGRAFLLSGAIVVIATPVVTDGNVGARVESATFAGVNLPESTKQEIADTFSRTLRSNIPTGVRVTRMTVNAGALVVEALPG
jgi:hypothetical protein